MNVVPYVFALSAKPAVAFFGRAREPHTRSSTPITKPSTDLPPQLAASAERGLMEALAVQSSQP
jgi:hypothetical protein